MSSHASHGCHNFTLMTPWHWNALCMCLTRTDCVRGIHVALDSIDKGLSYVKICCYIWSHFNLVNETKSGYMKAFLRSDFSLIHVIYITRPIFKSLKQESTRGLVSARYKRVSRYRSGLAHCVWLTHRGLKREKWRASVYVYIKGTNSIQYLSPHGQEFCSLISYCQCQSTIYFMLYAK